MTDLACTGLWLAVLVAGVGAAIGLRALGLPSTYVRDLLHVGGGTWVAGWALWTSPLPPLAITVGATAALAVVPLAAARLPLAARLHGAVTGDDERWAGLVQYALAFTALTAVALGGHPFTAACGVLALALGDGLGGAVGRRVGAHRFRARWGKVKSLEGSVTVAVAAALGVAIAARLFHRAAPPAIALAIGAAAALAEALAPRGTDNLLVPASAWAAAELLT